VMSDLSSHLLDLEDVDRIEDSAGLMKDSHRSEG